MFVSFGLLSSGAEASCRQAIRTARDIVRDTGEDVIARKARGIVKLARYSETNSERDCHNLMVKQMGLAIPIPLTKLTTEDPEQNVPHLRLTDWFQHFVDTNLWHVFTGLRDSNPKRETKILEHFWRNYRKCHPDHEIFQRADAGDLVLGRTCPITVHGDEGRGRRRAAFMVVSFHSLLGFGIAAGDERRLAEKKYIKLEPNFKGHSYTTRFVLGTLDKKTYGDQGDTVFRCLMDAVAFDCEHMASTGVGDKHGTRYWACLLHIVGDWPFLQKSGSLTRTFNNVDKKAAAKKKEPPKGICHLCRAGQTGVEYEQIATRRPAWLSTMYSESPFKETPAFLDLAKLPEQPEAMWAFDLWHCFHLGVGRNFIGAVLAIYAELEMASNVDDRFLLLTKRFQVWCREYSERCIVKKITKELLQYPNTGCFPTGTWHKGQVTTVFMRWIEHRFLFEQAILHDPLLKEAGEAAVSINACFREIYSAPLFLEPPLAKRISELGLKFLRRYASLANAARASGRALFVVMPKVHPLQHIMIEVLHAADCGVPCLNPISLSVQQDEDLIGRPSRLSRRVTGKAPALLHRVLQRYLQSCYDEFIKAGYILQSTL